jgi:hypothetical protein
MIAVIVLAVTTFVFFLLTIICGLRLKKLQEAGKADTEV